ncbi:MAG: hypothetical protein OEO71_01575 [Gammaproteobacteria bacterium]|nr:hypothetical protein [Gammaproteobacteria bacterium]
MNMTFQEKSAWGSLVALGLVSYWYFPAAFAAAGNDGAAADLITISIACVIALVVIEIIYHVIIASRGGDMKDERDDFVNLKAERIAGFVLGIGLFTLVGRIIAVEAIEALTPVETMTALTIAIWILFALTVSEVAKLISQIAYYRFWA